MGIPFFDSLLSWVSPRCPHSKDPYGWSFAQKARISFGVLAELQLHISAAFGCPWRNWQENREQKINGVPPSYSWHCRTTFLGSSGQKGRFSLGVLGVISLQSSSATETILGAGQREDKRVGKKNPSRFPLHFLDNRNSFSQSSGQEDRLSLYFVAHSHFRVSH